jgi:uncharacterized protein (DUF433 family)
MSIVELTRPATGDAPKTLDGLIIRDPRLRGGRPILAGTGVTVRTIAGHYKLGLNAEEISDDMDLDLTLVYAALTYYHLHKDEIEADILADSEEVLMEQYKEMLRDRPH